MVRVRESGGDWGKHNVEGEYCRGRILQAVKSRLHLCAER